MSMCEGMEVGREARVVRKEPSRRRDQVGRLTTTRKEIAWHPEGHLGGRQENTLSLTSHFFLLAYTDFPSSMKERKRKRRRERRGGRARRREKRERRRKNGEGGGEFCSSLQLHSIIL